MSDDAKIMALNTYMAIAGAVNEKAMLAALKEYDRIKSYKHLDDDKRIVFEDLSPAAYKEKYGHLPGYGNAEKMAFWPDKSSQNIVKKECDHYWKRMGDTQYCEDCGISENDLPIKT